MIYVYIILYKLKFSFFLYTVHEAILADVYRDAE